ncbi:gustatory receptor 98 [Tribolium castaneum]|uniref:Gustatory receptor n=2 Tax=Tribolium castaneum TaxID=7070 RepID=A2AXC0_TRICA|nr:gustatory receptor 98 [Tribolium castaneum]CAL23191.2 gustatory receptor candidate 58 [Tribolium castaneum]
MSYRLSRNDIRFLKVMYKLSHFLSITPNYDFENFVIISPRCDKISAICFLLSTILGTCWIIYVRIYCKEIRFFEISFEILGSLDSLILLMVLVSIILGSLKTKEWAKLNNKFQYIDEKLKTRDQKERNLFKNAYFQLVLSISVYSSSVGYTQYVRIAAKGLPTLKLFALHEFYGFCYLWVLILICNIALAFKQRYQLINEQMAVRINPKNCASFVIEVRKLSRLLGEMVGLFNDIFGWPLVFITGRFVIKILVALNFFTSTLEIDNLYLKHKLEISSLVQTAITLVAMCGLVLICDSAKSESQQTVFLCYKLMEKFPERSHEQQELYMAAQVIEKSVANFTAAGFFDVKRSTLFGILATTTTYLIVTIQFNQGLNK